MKAALLPLFAVLGLALAPPAAPRVRAADEAAPAAAEPAAAQPPVPPAAAPAASAAEPLPDPAILTAKRLEDSLAELAALRKRIGDEKIPLAEKLNGLENRQLDARREYDAVKRRLDTRNLDMNNLRNEIKSREQEKAYLSSLFGEYIRNLETRVHIAELGRYQKPIEEARLAPENTNLKTAEVYARQVGVIELSLSRLDELLGGAVFDGRAAGEDGLVKPGRFLLLGPVAYFASSDGSLAGVAEQRLGSLEPAVAPYADPVLADLTRGLVEIGRGDMPFDASLGNARKMEATQETAWEHILKGGAVMWPILGLAALVLLVALVKWISMAFVVLPGARLLQPLLRAVARNDQAAARTAVARIRGPAGALLKAGVDHLGQPKDLIEEVMFEKILDIKFRLNRALPFIAVGAAAAPLLGLLGTVTGIISTFKLITVFGSGDVKMLSAGISEALITTEYGLYVAIPSILAHAFLYRKAKALSDTMERTVISFLAEVTRFETGGTPPGDPPLGAASRSLAARRTETGAAEVVEPGMIEPAKEPA